MMENKNSKKKVLRIAKMEQNIRRMETHYCDIESFFKITSSGRWLEDNNEEILYGKYIKISDYS